MIKRKLYKYFVSILVCLTMILPNLTITYANEDTKSIKYVFESTDVTKQLPKEVTNLPTDNPSGQREEDITDKKVGDEVKIKQPSFYNKVKLPGVTWKFLKYDTPLIEKTEGWLFFKSTIYYYKVIDGENKIVGKWEPINTMDLNYKFKSKDNIPLPKEITDKLPSSQYGFEKGDMVYAPKINDVFVEEDGQEYTWHLTWNNEKYTFEDGNYTFVGEWEKSKTYKVKYDFKSATEGKNLSENVLNELPKDKSGLKNGDNIPLPKFKEEVNGDDENPGKWHFDGWQKAEDSIKNSNVTLVGLWSFKEATWDGIVKFHMEDDSIKEVHFNNPDTEIGAQGLPKGGGRSFLKYYNIGWSTEKNFSSSNIPKNSFGFFWNPIKQVFPGGLTGELNLYPAKLTAFSVASDVLKTDTRPQINEDLNNKDFKTLPTSELVEVEKTDKKNKLTALYVKSLIKDDKVPINLVATMVQPKSIVLATYYDFTGPVRWHPNWVALHFKLDDRVEYFNEATLLKFTSYNWAPASLQDKDGLIELSVDGKKSVKNKVNGSPAIVGLANFEGFPYSEGIINNISKDLPETAFNFYPQGEKEFILRCDLRKSLEKQTDYLIEATPEEIFKPAKFEMVGEGSPVYISKEMALNIALGKEKPLLFTGFINGNAEVAHLGSKVYGPIEATPLEIDFKLPTVTFVRNYPEDLSETLVGERRVAESFENNSKIDDLKLELIPNLKVPVGYKFKGWNTEPDGTGISFDSYTEVNKNIKVYAIWEKETPTPTPTPTPHIIQKHIPKYKSKLKNTSLPNTSVESVDHNIFVILLLGVFGICIKSIVINKK